MNKKSENDQRRKHDWAVFFTIPFENFVLHNTYKLETFTMSKTDRHLLRQKVRKRISGMKTNTRMFPENWHFTRFALKAAKTAVFAFII